MKMRGAQRVRHLIDSIHSELIHFCELCNASQRHQEIRGLRRSVIAHSQRDFSHLAVVVLRLTRSGECSKWAQIAAEPAQFRELAQTAQLRMAWLFAWQRSVV